VRAGLDGETRRRIQTAAKTITFMDEVMAVATGNGVERR